ncbi:hypothetical protein LEP1GSC047_3964 [Leptospira inadai serovar Lyme str. 10]|uniref:Uncharacterized protein n=2 Tax=Leptospira inadai serovar Lyme TaxID=293084 RepID=V6HCP5_9LEPT|nr:hypothetical protein LEP1GSC047_3964 [Leptospira inadai serovar Lyme str. 10]PNV75135.1 hypothetical protein BES34_009555 [Leptospira inadai serovar Lyme]
MGSDGLAFQQLGLRPQTEVPAHSGVSSKEIFAFSVFLFFYRFYEIRSVHAYRIIPGQPPHAHLAQKNPIPIGRRTGELSQTRYFTSIFHFFINKNVPFKRRLEIPTSDLRQSNYKRGR